MFISIEKKKFEFWVEGGKVKFSWVLQYQTSIKGTDQKRKFISFSLYSVRTGTSAWIW